MISHNELSSGSLGDGLRIAAGARHTLVRNSTATANQDDGIDTDEPTTVLTDNTANDNWDLGIEAVPGVTGRGNRASGNGNPFQCTGIRSR